MVLELLMEEKRRRTPEGDRGGDDPTAVYAGFPAALNGVSAAREVLQRGDTVPPLDD